MQAVKDFLLGNPWGVFALAVISAASWDLVKFLYVYFFDARKRLVDELEFADQALSQFKNGSFLIELLFKLSRLIFLCFILTGLFVVSVMFRVDHDKYGATETSILKWLVFGLSTFFFVNVGGLYRTIERWHGLVCAPNVSLEGLEKKLSSLSKTDIDTLSPRVKEIAAKIADLQLDITNRKVP
ncbi:hypothetical protein [Rhizobium leguminosarum]|uniref:hypothetical protein n=1 Tax=Rhizobium leguminosarum TaxID=384 RepID=UPI003F9E1116